MEYLTLGPVPADERCQQVGTPSYDPAAARIESQRYIALLKQLFPDYEANECSFRRKSFPHDLGTYTEVCVFYNTESENSVNFATNVENNLPSSWDDEPTKQSKSATCSICESDLTALGFCTSCDRPI